jgi:hypothetical protein
MRTSPEIARIIHPFEQGEPTRRTPERRCDPRWSYPVTQLIAFHDEHQLPTKEMLQPVRCGDISMGGISFFVSEAPTKEHCTLVLGRAPRLIFVKARVVHVERPEAPQSEWRIGCQFIAKVGSILG